MTFVNVIILYLAFRAKQVICDFFLQTSWMASVKGSPFNMGGAKALGLHAGIHAVATLLLMLIFAPDLWWLAAVDFVVHAVIDKVKGAITNRFGWTYKDNPYWWAFGIDQEMHNLTHFAYVLIILAHQGLNFSASLPLAH